MEYTFHNINDAFYRLVSAVDHGIKHSDPILSKTNSRNGGVWQYNEPVTITYKNPTQRVLLNSHRHANPFFHLYEALWMLAGRNDVAPLKFYSSKIDQFSDDGKTFNGAYGYRWRQARTPGDIIQTYSDERDGGGLTGPGTQANRVVQRVGVDQLSIIANHLKALPNSRRAVLSMWNVADDLLRAGPEREDCPIVVTSRDICCNLNVMFSLRDLVKITQPTGNPKWDRNFEPTEYMSKALDMTVTNRSNDLIWGTLGANIVHFSILQEYMAARIGVSVGRYHHFTNNLHVYEWNWKPEEWLKEYDNPGRFNLDFYKNEQYRHNSKPGRSFIPLVRDSDTFEQELPVLVNHFGKPPGQYIMDIDELTEPFFRTVAGPMFQVFQLYKLRAHVSAMMMCSTVASPDWRRAGILWLTKQIAIRDDAEALKVARQTLRQDGYDLERELYHGGQEYVI